VIWGRCWQPRGDTMGGGGRNLRRLVGNSCLFQRETLLLVRLLVVEVWSREVVVAQQALVFFGGGAYDGGIPQSACRRSSVFGTAG
jgi:hypothetical protein